MAFMQSGGYAVSTAMSAVELPTLVVWGRNDEILRCVLGWQQVLWMDAGCCAGQRSGALERL